MNYFTVLDVMKYIPLTIVDLIMMCIYVFILFITIYILIGKQSKKLFCILFSISLIVNILMISYNVKIGLLKPKYRYKVKLHEGSDISDFLDKYILISRKDDILIIEEK